VQFISDELVYAIFILSGYLAVPHLQFKFKIRHCTFDKLLYYLEHNS